MEVSDPVFPIRNTMLSLNIKEHKTDIVISSYEDHFLVIATQIGSMGTILHARKEEGVSVDPTFSVSVVFGKRDEPMLVACARQLIEHISNSGLSKALVLSLGLRDHSTETLKGIVTAVIEKFAEDGKVLRSLIRKAILLECAVGSEECCRADPGDFKNFHGRDAREFHPITVMNTM
ncbi:hypothetical protein Salat_2190200 [Sesamum alatum]|uniref:Proteasome assembly chaperone 3 n=1 Tax=Sesamum alatum TaxID=300844 RepID=A0AAE1XTQ5_9LAMI|nr:hypothetical protein Salat_2190200 [Sesamum alatum]